MKTEYRLMSRDEVVGLAGLDAIPTEDSDDIDFAEWYYDVNYINEDYEALIELQDGRYFRLVHVDYPVEAKDATLYRSFDWVIDELNDLAERLNKAI